MCYVQEALKQLGIGQQEWLDASERVPPCGELNRRARSIGTRGRVCRWLRDNTEWSLPDIARAVGYRTHTSVIDVLRRFGR